MGDLLEITGAYDLLPRGWYRIRFGAPLPLPIPGRHRSIVGNETAMGYQDRNWVCVSLQGISCGFGWSGIYAAAVGNGEEEISEPSESGRCLLSHNGPLLLLQRGAYQR